MIDSKVKSLGEVGKWISQFLTDKSGIWKADFEKAINDAKIQNPWFTEDNVRYCLQYWASHLTESNITAWLSSYTLPTQNSSKKIGLILAGNIPMVGFHDILSVILTDNIPQIKLSSKDSILIPFILKYWKEIDPEIRFEYIEKINHVDAVIATGSDNTARYFEYYFKNIPHIIRKNRTSIAILTGDETTEELNLLGHDIFTYFGLGCRNVTHLLVPENYNFNLFFESIFSFNKIIDHHKYANNYDYYRAIYLLNQDKFLDNNFLIIKEDKRLFCPIANIFHQSYKDEATLNYFLNKESEHIQTIVGKTKDCITAFGQSQNPSLNAYADGIDTIDFLLTLNHHNS